LTLRAGWHQLDGPVGRRPKNLEPQAVPEASVHYQWSAFDDMTLKPFDLESRGHFEYERFAFRSGIAANRDNLSLFDSLHDDVAQ
jgi:hypothetical protein